MKPLDIVITPKGSIGIITETNDKGNKASVKFFRSLNQGDKNAWWIEEDGLVVIDNLPRVLASSMKHPFGIGEDDVNHFFGERKPVDPLKSKKETLIEEFSRVLDVTPSMIKGVSKKRRSTVIRRLYWLLEREKNGITYQEIGEITGHTYSTVYTGIRNIKLLFRYKETLELELFKKVQYLFPENFKIENFN